MAKAMTEVKLKGVHAHGCTQCHWRYEDACDTPLANRVCVECRTGKPGFIVIRVARLAQDCCRKFARVATIDEQERYRLGGNAPWYICPPSLGGCARTHPYDDPKLEESFDGITHIAAATRG